MNPPRLLTTTLLFTTLLALPARASQTTPLQTLYVDADSTGNYMDLDGTEINLSTNQPVTGFTKFDPALGTLVEILFTVEVDASLTLTVEASEVNDPGQPFSVYLDGSDALMQVDVLYSPTGQAFGKPLTFDNGGSFSVGIENGDPTDYTFDDVFSFQESSNIAYGGFADGGNLLTLGSLPATDPDLNPADFIGTGNVVGLSFFHVVIVSTSPPDYLTLSNVPGAYVESLISHQGGNVTLQYVYEPAATTAPTLITNYQKSGTTHTFNFTGEASRTNWVIKGGSTLESLTTDHTSAATISETSPGIYEAIVPLPAVLDPSYFFRIK